MKDRVAAAFGGHCPTVGRAQRSGAIISVGAEEEQGAGHLFLVVRPRFHLPLGLAPSIHSHNSLFSRDLSNSHSSLFSHGFSNPES